MAASDALRPHLLGQAASRDDCGRETLALLRAMPDLRGFVGSCMVRGGRSLATMEAVHGCDIPWTHHVWAIDPDGVLIDPTAAELLPDLMKVFYEPPAPLEQLPARIVWDPAHQSAELAKLDDADRPRFDVLAELIYLPGNVNPHTVGPAWWRLAEKSRNPAVGFGADDLAPLVDREHRSFAPRGRRRVAPRGFAMEVQ